ncbi:Glycine cleavage system protein H [Fasciolopsis buskii]|uniref:Glycine cleavage system H protein n=1 Tax=Fasciolopsis buskii TaxID=27845 RepID=A0A8E0RLH2_9TREM|nr:Glycine cleavage system protein H [Fasciolopsis buski]
MPHTNLFFPFPVSMCYLFARPLVSFRTLLLHPFCLNGANTVRRFSSAKFTQVGIKNGSDVHFTQKHEWIKVDPMSKIGIVGITEYAEQKLGDIVFVELPEKNNEVHAHEQCGIIESVKAVSEIYSPASGQVVEVNPVLEDNTAIINKSPMDEGWLFKMSLSNLDELNNLMSPEKYKHFLESEHQ